MIYSKTVMDHFRNPRNVGIIEDADGTGEVGNPLCGDMMTIYLKIVDDTIADIKFQTFGCGSAIAVSSMLKEMAMGKTLREARAIRNKDVANALEGLPKNKLHCSNLGADALAAAIKNYEDKKAGIEKPDPVPKEAHEHHSKDKCYCPYCDAEVDTNVEFCVSCQSDNELGTKNYRVKTTRYKSNKREPHKRSIKDELDRKFNENYIHQHIRKDEFDGDWPFYREEIFIECRDHHWCIVTIDGVDYALNGAAQARYKLKSVHDAGMAVLGKSISPFIDMAINLKKNKNAQPGH